MAGALGGGHAAIQGGNEELAADRLAAAEPLISSAAVGGVATADLPHDFREDNAFLTQEPLQFLAASVDVDLIDEEPAGLALVGVRDRLRNKASIHLDPPFPGWRDSPRQFPWRGSFARPRSRLGGREHDR
jgi:hypothetical protein